MESKCVMACIISIAALMFIGIGHAGVLVEDFEYLDPNDFTWTEHNGNAAITLVPSDSNDFHQVMKYEYWCGTAPYFTEAFTIFSEAQDWSMYDTFGMWVKGRTSLQSLEDMYVVIYTSPDPNDSMTHANLVPLGTARFYKVTQLPNWTYWRADIDYQFEPLTHVWGIGIGMMPTSYGHGIVLIDNLAVSHTGQGGVIDNFEMYADDSDLLLNVTPGTKNCTISLEDTEVFKGNHAMRVQFNNGADPWWTKVTFSKNVRHLGYNWNAMGYTTLTMHFKVTDPEGYLKLSLFDKGGSNKASYTYNGGARLTAGDWTRWDIDLRSVLVTNPKALDEIARVDIQFQPLDYGVGVVYVDDIYVNVCGLRSDLCDQNCFVHLPDFSVLASQWGRTDCAAPDYCMGADLLIENERDGKVDIADAAILISEWLKCEMLYEDDCPF